MSGFQDEDITILSTDEVEVGASEAPTRDNIVSFLKCFILSSQSLFDLCVDAES